MKCKVVFMYGTKAHVLRALRAVAHTLGRVRVVTASELCPALEGGVAYGYRFTQGYTPRMRNQRAAMDCHALIVCDVPRYAHAVVTAFKQRGRDIYWHNGIELKEYTNKASLVRAYYALPGEGLSEPELWDRQALELKERNDAYTPYNYDRLDYYITQYMVGCARCIAWLSMNNRKDVDSIRPNRNWNEVCDDVECSEDDVLHPLNQQIEEN